LANCPSSAIFGVFVFPTAQSGAEPIWRNGVNPAASAAAVFVSSQLHW
jgi:hypothetical protein